MFISVIVVDGRKSRPPLSFKAVIDKTIVIAAFRETTFAQLNSS
jgi:hypothetical protein